jgi:hypothetical protein
MTSQEASAKQQERTSKLWERRRERWGAWKAMQRDFTLPACLRCGHRFKPEHEGQDVCSKRCFLIHIKTGGRG